MKYRRRIFFTDKQKTEIWDRWQRGESKSYLYLFVGSQTGGKSAAIAYALIETAKLSGGDPQTWLADTLARIPDHKINRIGELVPWNAR